MARPKFILASSETCADLLHATRFRAPDPFAFLEMDGKRHILLHDLEIDRGRMEAKVDVVDSWTDFEKLAGKTPWKRPRPAKVLAAWLTSKGATSVKVPSDFPLGTARELAKHKIDLKPSRGPLYPNRSIKSRPEVHAMEKALAIAEKGMARGIEVLRASRIRSDGTLSFEGHSLTSEALRIEMETAVLRAGGEARGDSIAACGAQACDPHMRGSGPLQANSLIILDVFPRDAASGFFGDITRTVVRGKADDAMRRMWETCLEGQKLALDAIRPDAKGSEIHNAVKEFFTSKGYPTEIREGRWQGFFHGTGHGLGLEIHEEPRFSDTIFEPGQVMTVEPGIYMPGIGGVRHEDVVLVTRAGHRLLTTLPKPFEI
jgi:Xaa-Pro aminopeptidase